MNDEEFLDEKKSVALFCLKNIKNDFSSFQDQQTTAVEHLVPGLSL